MEWLSKNRSKGWAVYRRPDRESAWVRLYHTGEESMERMVVAIFENERSRIIKAGEGEALLLHNGQHMARFEASWWEALKEG